MRATIKKRGDGSHCNGMEKKNSLLFNPEIVGRETVKQVSGNFKNSNAFKFFFNLEGTYKEKPKNAVDGTEHTIRPQTKKNVTPETNINSG